MKNCSQCGASLNDDDKFCSKCGTAQPQSAEPKPKVLFEVPPTIEFLNKALSIKKIALDKGLVLLFLSVDKALDEPARQVVQKLVFAEQDEILPRIPPEDDRYEIIAEEFDKSLEFLAKTEKNRSLMGSPVLIGPAFLRSLAVLAAFDGVYSENEKKLIRRFVRRWNNYKIGTSALESLETAIVRLCENENKRREIRGSSKNYQQVTLELSAITKTDEEIVKGLFDL